MKRLGYLLALLVVLQSSTFAQAATHVQVTSDQGSQKTLHAQTDIDAPPAIVWENLTNYANIKNIMPGYNRSTVLQDNGSSATVEFGLKPAAIAPAFRYQVKIQENRSANTITLQRVSGDFKSIQATYKLIPLDGGNRTRLVYDLRIDLGSVTLPGTTQMLKGNTEKGLVAMQRHCGQRYKMSLSASADR